MDKINFSLMQIIIETNDVGERFISPDASIFASLVENTSYTFDDNYYEIATFKESKYLWMTFNYGRPNPRDEKVTNIETQIKRDNDRKENEVELLNQLFVLYDYNFTLYISDSRRKKLLESFLKDKLGMDLVVKSFYKTEHEVIEILRQVDKIQFAHITNLFSQDSKQKQALIDLTGVDAPYKFTIEAEYRKSNRLTSFVKELFDAKNEQKISDLVICGRSEENFSFVYNVDTFSRKIEVCCTKENNGKFDQGNVLKELLKHINIG